MPSYRGIIPDARLGADAVRGERRNEQALVVVEIGEERTGGECDVSQLGMPPFVMTVVAIRG